MELLLHLGGLIKTFFPKISDTRRGLDLDFCKALTPGNSHTTQGYQVLSSSLSFFFLSRITYFLKKLWLVTIGRILSVIEVRLYAIGLDA